MSPSPQPNSAQRLAWPGKIALIAGVFVLVLQGLESSQSLPGMPRFWHQNQSLWFLIGLATLVLGCRWTWQSSSSEDDKRHWRPTKPGSRFHQLTLYSRTNCPLCDEAAEVLADYSSWLPTADEVDIDLDPALRQQFDTTVPVVACDGKIRFRGRIDETLLRRLIEGTPPISRS